MIDLVAIFKENDDEYLKFDRIESPLHPRPDVCAFLLLHAICPGSNDIIGGAEHDIIFLNVDEEELNEAATVENIVTLVRCGVVYSNEYGCLAMFV